MKIDAAKDFGVRECPQCAVDVPANENRCPICGYEFPNEPASRKRAKWILAFLMLVLFILIFSGLF